MDVVCSFRLIRGNERMFEGHSFYIDLPEIYINTREIHLDENGSLTVECRAIGKPQPIVRI